MLSDYRMGLFFGRFPDFACIVLVRTHVDEDKYRSNSGMIMTGKIEELGEKNVLVPPFPPQISHRITWEGTRTSAVTGRRITPRD